MPTFMKLDDAFRDWYLEQTGVLLDKDLVLLVLRTLQGHPEAARLWEEHISAILKDVGFKNAMHEKNIYTGQFCGEKVLLVCQVDDFALGCRQESTAKSVYSDIGAKLTLHNEAEDPFEYLGLVDSFDGYDVLQTCDCIKLSVESYIRRLLKAHGWDNPSPRESSNKLKPPLHESDVANLFNLAAGPVENAPEQKALEAEQGFGLFWLPECPRRNSLCLCTLSPRHWLCGDDPSEVLYSTQRFALQVPQTSGDISPSDARLGHYVLVFRTYRISSRGASCSHEV